MLEAAVNRSLSAEKVIPQAGALPDPQISLSMMNLPVNSFSFTQEPMTGKVISVTQMFPFPGKLDLKTEMAEFEAVAIHHQQEEVRNTVVQMVKTAYYSLYGIDRALETVQKNQSLMEQFVHMAETKYATGSGLQQDVLRAQVELSKMEDDLIMWQQKRLGVAAKLNALLNRSSDSPIAIIQQELSLSPIMPINVSDEEVEENRPLLKAWKEKIHKVESAVEFAKMDIWPNFMVGASYNQRDDLKSGMKMHDFFSAMVSLNIPLYQKRKQKMKVVETELALAAVKAEYENVKTGVLADIQSQRAELDRFQKRADLYKGGILIQAQQSLDSAYEGYRVGKVDFLTLISNWMMLQNYELQYYFALAEYYKSLAGYEQSIGIQTSELERSNDVSFE
ncbi:MAG: TolC family protein [Candidatus Aminicenantes bacterium]|nr:TolC family protein [Candidatus Aminicenantes bacterium]